LNNQPLSEKEFEIINIIADGFRSNQRELSTHIGLSLGMTNLLLRRLATKGFLRIKQLDAKKVQYLLTPRGLAEKAQKSIHYTRKTLQSFGIIKEEIKRLLKISLTDEIKQFYVVGEGDLADLVSMILRDQFPEERYIIKHLAHLPAEVLGECLVLDAVSEPSDSANGLKNHINVLALLSENLSFHQNPSNKVAAR